MNSEQIQKFFADYQVVLKRVEQLEAAMRCASSPTGIHGAPPFGSALNSSARSMRT